MNQRIRLRLPSIFIVAALVLAAASCQTKKRAEEAPPVEHVGSSPMGTTQAVLNKSFAVKTSVTFPFEIPAHAAMPRLRGSYKSFVTKLGIQSNEDSANVDFFVLTEDQYADFLRGSVSDLLFSAEASHDQAVDVSIPPSLNQPRKYYLVFRSTPGGDPRKVVQADLTVDF
jgi:hypothetical protein